MTDVAVASLPSALRESKASSRVGAGDARDAVVSRHELAVFRSWLKQQPHLPQDIPDDMLMMFLHSQDHLLERAKAVLDRSYTIRTYATDIFSDRNPLLPELQNVFSIGYFGPLPRACPDGVMPVVCAIKDADPNKFNFVHCVKIALMVADFTIIRNGPVGGYRLILDMRGASIGHLAKVNFAAMKHGLDYQQEGLPVKLKGVHVINASALIHQIMVLVKPLLNQKSREMLHVHTEAQMPKFYDQYCPQALMPKDYGGDSPCLEDLNNMVKRGVENLAPWYREEERLRVNESLRPSPSRSRGSYTSPESFGCNGSFKKLNLD